MTDYDATIGRLFDVIVGRGGRWDAAARGDAFDQLTGEGERAVPAIVDAAASRRAWLIGAEILGSLKVPHRARAIRPVLKDARREARTAALIALGRSGDREAADLLVEAFLGGMHRRTALTELGNLGVPSVVAPVREEIVRSVGDPMDPRVREALYRRAEQDRDPLDLLLLTDAACAFAKLGDLSLVGLAIELSQYRPDESLEFFEAAQVRCDAIAALDVSTGHGVADALIAACADSISSVADAALTATLRVGRLREADSWLVLGNGPESRNHMVRWCLQQFTGDVPPKDWEDMAAWWSKIRSRFDRDICIRHGQAASPALHIERLDGQDGRFAREELQHDTGITFVHIYSIPSPEEREQIDRWWAANSSRFTPGKLHRWGRTFEPEAVDSSQ